MSNKKIQTRTQTNSSNPFTTLAECVGTAIVAVAMVPAMIIDAVVTSATS